MKRSILFICLNLLCLFAPRAYADEIRWIQPYESKIFGTVTMPAFWDVSENENELKAVESNVPQPLKISLFLVSVPKFLTAEEAVAGMKKSIAEQLKPTRVEEEKDLPEIEKITPKRWRFACIEKDAERIHEILFLPGNKILVIDIVAPVERQNEISEAWFNEILNGMKQ